MTVTALTDDDAVTDDPVVLTHTASGGDYANVDGDGVEVSIEESDSPGVSLSVEELTPATAGARAAWAGVCRSSRT